MICIDTRIYVSLCANMNTHTVTTTCLNITSQYNHLDYLLDSDREVTFWVYPDLNFWQGLLDIFPFASDDLEARSAIWNIMARLLFRVQESEMSPSTLHRYVFVLASKCDQIEDDLLNDQLDGPKSDAQTTAVSFLMIL